MRKSTVNEELRILGQQSCPGEEADKIGELIDAIVDKETSFGNLNMTWLFFQIFEYGVLWGKRIERARRQGKTRKERYAEWT